MATTYAVLEVMTISTRKARNRFEVDLLPPFGKPEVVSFGPAATDATHIVAVAVAAILLLTATE